MCSREWGRFLFCIFSCRRHATRDWKMQDEHDAHRNHARCFRGYARAGGGASAPLERGVVDDARSSGHARSRPGHAARCAGRDSCRQERASLSSLASCAVAARRQERLLRVGRDSMRARCQGRRALALSKCVCCRRDHYGDSVAGHHGGDADAGAACIGQAAQGSGGAVRGAVRVCRQRGFAGAAHQ